MVPRKDLFEDEDSFDERPGKGRSFGKNEKDKRRFDSQEDFGITRRAKSRSDVDDDDEEFLDDEFLDDDDDLDFDDDELDFDDDDFDDDDDL